MWDVRQGHCMDFRIPLPQKGIVTITIFQNIGNHNVCNLGCKNYARVIDVNEEVIHFGKFSWNRK